MSEERLERIEDMLSQLIGMVGETNKKYDSMDNRMENMESKVDSVGSKVDSMGSKMDTMDSKFEGKMDLMRDENDKRHQDVMERFNSLEADQDHIWKKAVTNEREFAKFKIQYGI